MVPAATLAALKRAAERIEAFHRRHKPADDLYTDEIGVTLGARWTPVDAAGLYVPGGLAAYPSSVLMNAIPAKIAGVKRLVAATPAPDGKLNPLVLAAADLVGVNEIYRIGGAQAIAALAYGTKTIPRVDKIVGPGNAYVAEAKRQVFGEVGIEMVAGPSEILVIADGSVPADWTAMDLFSQAEHDESARAILLSPDAAYLGAVEAAVGKLLPDMARRKVIAASLKARGAFNNLLSQTIPEAGVAAASGGNQGAAVGLAAQRLGLSHDAARKRFQRALGRLREHLASSLSHSDLAGRVCLPTNRMNRPEEPTA